MLINDTFVPELDHQKVLGLFRNAPVDSHTRLSLVSHEMSRDTAFSARLHVCLANVQISLRIRSG